MIKDFDCVEMKRKAQERIYWELKGLSPEQERQYWREQGEELVRLREECLKKNSTSASSPSTQ